MTTVNPSPPNAQVQTPTDVTTPTHVPLLHGGSIETIVLELEEQQRRSRALRNDARDASRELQARSIEQTRKAATISLVSSLVSAAAQTASSLASTLRSTGSETPQGDVPQPKSGAAPTVPSGATPPAPEMPDSAPKDNNQTQSSGHEVVGLDVAGGLGSMVGSVGEHFASRATTRSEVSRHAAEAYGDVADDAAQAEEDAQRMADRALQHLDAIDAARRDAVASILRG